MFRAVEAVLQGLTRVPWLSVTLSWDLRWSGRPVERPTNIPREIVPVPASDGGWDSWRSKGIEASFASTQSLVVRM